jgi:hypothetical protein
MIRSGDSHAVRAVTGLALLVWSLIGFSGLWLAVLGPLMP